MVRIVIKASLILCFSYVYDNKVTVRTGATSRYADVINSIIEQWNPIICIRIYLADPKQKRESYAESYILKSYHIFQNCYYKVIIIANKIVY